MSFFPLTQGSLKNKDLLGWEFFLIAEILFEAVTSGLKE